MKNFDVVALGELLIDFTENGKSAQGNMTYEANPGGAPCNVLAMLNKAGRKTAFIGKVGQDLFGNKLKATLDEVGIDTSNHAGIRRDFPGRRQRLLFLPESRCRYDAAQGRSA